MDFAELHEIIRYIKDTFPCAFCRKSYSNKSLSVIATLPYECVLMTYCDNCKLQSLLHVVITTKIIKNIKEKHIDIRKATQQYVSHNDVLDIKNFLKNFDGDFKTIFQS